MDEVDARVVAAGVRRPAQTKATQDSAELWCAPGHGTQLVRDLASAGERPIVIRVIPGTPAATAVEAAGGRVIQSVPAAYVPSAHPAVQAWAEQHLAPSRTEGVHIDTGDRYSLDDLLDMWMTPYLRMHEDWAPTGDVEATRQAFARRFAQDLDVRRTTVAVIGGQPVAAVFTVGPFDGTLMPVLIQIDDRHPGRKRAATAAVATMLIRATPIPVEFDGHADEPVYMNILHRIPERSSGNRTPMNLTEVS
ncbi:hypothetical protein [Serinicoccus sp. LYQ131]|uniref:hypothetical protein n=1 Tax=Serinicoccus sp. LYQ131 TaxID=3378797 RepID=UPI003852B857